MASNTTVAVLLIAYVFCCFFFLYFCAIADPSTSNTAYFLTVSGPNRAWFHMEKVLGEKKLGILTSILDRALVVVYLVVVCGAWSVVFWYIYPWISSSSYVWNLHKVVGYVVFVACFGSWRLASRTSPGIITARTYKRYDHYPHDSLMFLPNRRCESTGLIRLARSKFDRLKYNQNVPRYDHFCGWVFNTIGEENYRWFLLFLAVHVLMCAYGSYVSIALFRGEIIEQQLMELTFFDRATGETFKADWFIVFQYLFTRRMPECAVLAVMFVMCLALGAFLGYHVYLTSYNMTTNESTKWADIKDWYKKEKRKYDKAVKDGLVNPEDEEEDEESEVSEEDEGIELNDGDVTCTPGASSTGASKSPEPERPIYRDPGPVPTNIYDRGFVENWKEVLFPISLRENAKGETGTSDTISSSFSSLLSITAKKTKDT